MIRFTSLISLLLLVSLLFAQHRVTYSPFPEGPKLLPHQTDSLITADTVTDTLFTTYYAKKFEGRRTANGQIYRGSKFTAAHRTLPFGTIVSVQNLHTGKIIEVRINDRGPFSKKFELDISQGAAKALGIYRLGYAKVEVKYVLKTK